MPRAGDSTPDVARARARYETARTLLVGLLVVIVLASLALVIVIGLEIREQGRAAEKQSAQIEALLDRQATNDASRQQLIDDAVARIAAEQYRALVAHDNRVTELLRRNTRLIDQEVNGPRNQEQRALPPIPRPAAAPPSAAAPAPRVGPPTGVQPAPCQVRGKSGKCRR